MATPTGQGMAQQRQQPAAVEVRRTQDVNAYLVHNAWQEGRGDRGVDYTRYLVHVNMPVRTSSPTESAVTFDKMVAMFLTTRTYIELHT